MKLLNFLKEEKIVSCGLVLTDNIKFLAVHPTFGTKWDIPKGMHEGGSYIDTVLREVREEVGIDFSKYKSKIEYKGRYKYSEYKDLQIFLLVIDDLPQTSLMSCSSTFNAGNNRRLPEVDDYKYLKIGNFSFFNFSMKKILEDVLR